ncbi:MAG: 3-isopropylmalate dehydratase [Bacillus thermozeamaize]|uniref:3-isopropylmalate dehydratase small subunit n=1 Tax=Bacillus thermozeamaize TaxID=230954 RepID=A0A1Y3PSQ4_9BACI|nr:MAG: 3-isopropylmalate dehydratase [Bacillus thermozeamaize]
MKRRGKAWVFGDNVDTDVISPGQYLKLTAEEVAKHVMEGADPEFAKKVQPGDIIVAGKNFGCGSSRESAPAALKYAGVGAVVAEFFARIFYRNAINLGLPVLECKQAKEIAEGDELEIDLEKGEIYNVTQNKTYSVTPFPPRILAILQAGGLVPLLEKEQKRVP